MCDKFFNSNLRHGYCPLKLMTQFSGSGTGIPVLSSSLSGSPLLIFSIFHRHLQGPTA
jgi:hypothetical protein